MNKLMSINVNGLGNSVKRAKIMTQTQINFLQETHLSQKENEKLKRFGFKNTFYSSHSNTRKRGVAILISSKTKFECQNEIKDKEGQYIIVKLMFTLVNIFAPLKSDNEFFKHLFNTITVETEGICISGGDRNVIMDCNLDTASCKKNKKPAWAFLMCGETYSTPAAKRLQSLFSNRLCLFYNQLFFHAERK